MGAGGVAGGADRADRGAADDGVARLHAGRRLVAVPDLGAVAQRLDGPVAVGAGPADRGDRARGDRADRRAGRCGEVQAGVAVRPQAAALPEACGEAIDAGGQGRDPGVLGELLGDVLGAGGELGDRGVGLACLLGGPREGARAGRTATGDLAGGQRRGARTRCGQGQRRARHDAGEQRAPRAGGPGRQGGHPVIVPDGGGVSPGSARSGSRDIGARSHTPPRPLPGGTALI